MQQHFSLPAGSPSYCCVGTVKGVCKQCSRMLQCHFLPTALITGMDSSQDRIASGILAQLPPACSHMALRHHETSVFPICQILQV